MAIFILLIFVKIFDTVEQATVYFGWIAEYERTNELNCRSYASNEKGIALCRSRSCTLSPFFLWHDSAHIWNDIRITVQIKYETIKSKLIQRESHQFVMQKSKCCEYARKCKRFVSENGRFKVAVTHFGWCRPVFCCSDFNEKRKRSRNSINGDQRFYCVRQRAPVSTSKNYPISQFELQIHECKLYFSRWFIWNFFSLFFVQWLTLFFLSWLILSIE